MNAPTLTPEQTERERKCLAERLSNARVELMAAALHADRLGARAQHVRVLDGVSNVDDLLVSLTEWVDS
mgnify:CR=1 FL=1